MCIRDRTKTKIFKTIVRSIVTYGSEVWTTNKHTRSKLMTAKMDIWRCSTRECSREKIRNEVITDRMNV